MFLSPYIKVEDTQALCEILALTTEHTTRDELLELMQQYDAKQSRIQVFEQSYQAFLEEYKQKEATYQGKINELVHAKKRLLSKFQFIDKYEPAVQE